MKPQTVKAMNAALIAGIAVLPLALIYALGGAAGRAASRSGGLKPSFEEQYPDPHLGI